MNGLSLRLSFLTFCITLPFVSVCEAQIRPNQRGGNQAPVKLDKPLEAAAHPSFKARELEKLAVIVSTDAKVPTVKLDKLHLVEDIFVETLLQKGHTVQARPDLTSILKDQPFATAGLTDQDATTVGKQLAVPAVLIVKVDELASVQQMDRRKNMQVMMAKAGISARLIHTETGDLWWEATFTFAEPIKINNELLMALSKSAERLSKAFPDKNPEPVQFDSKELLKLAMITTKDDHQPVAAAAGRQGNATPKMAPRQRLLEKAAPKAQEPEQKLDDAEIQKLVEGSFPTLLEKKGYTLVARLDVEKIAQEEQFQPAGLTEANVTDFGKSLDVPAVMVVRISQCDTEQQKRTARGVHTYAVASMGARLVSVETGQVLWCRARIEEQELQGTTDAAAVMTKLTKKLVDMFPDQKTASKPSTTKTR